MFVGDVYAKLRYTNFEKGALAVLLTVDKFHIYLDHKRFELQTDNNVLSYSLSGTKHKLQIWAVINRLILFFEK
ncbi:hypothetical protein ANN_26789 [Periplaneta americana]|uniref:Reverse transcriptase RNase H-like domain-containing protein n=1 Tax=Periplaneta americana TaxID=6978 RepID=A0ABQ8RZL4_PERAM|nr:hypothetical protein ANN_26789 [Periplaneta americana]